LGTFHQGAPEAGRVNAIFKNKNLIGSVILLFKPENQCTFLRQDCPSENAEEETSK
jgi:hypothetical protein